MKTLKLFSSLLITLFFIYSCSNDSQKAGNRSSFELLGSDTVNRRDANGLKQEHWIIFDNSDKTNTPYSKSAPDSSESQRSLTTEQEPIPVEEGDYKDDKKQGVWRYYESNGALKNTIEYKDDNSVSN